jgi:hypothetical protein
MRAAALLLGLCLAFPAFAAYAGWYFADGKIVDMLTG